IMGLAKKYFSYVRPREEYQLKEYEGASTLAGPQEARAVVEMLRQVRDSAPAPTRQIAGKTYSVGFDPPKPFGPPVLARPRDMVDADMDAAEPAALALSESQVPRAEWKEDASADWLACRRHVRIWSIDGQTAALADDEPSWDILTILKAPSDASGAPARIWNALWLPPSGTPVDRQYVFEILMPDAASRCTAPFSLRHSPPVTMPMPAYFAD